jgi:nucleotide-binding universal stress UspA family protein
MHEEDAIGMTDANVQSGRVVVVGYDGSPTARAAVDYAAGRAGPDGRVFVVHAYGPPSDWLGYPDFDRILHDHQERGRALMDGLAMGDDDLLKTDWETELVEGPAADAILRVADARHADEIVVGSRARGRVAAAALGSVSHDVVHGARVPVVVVPPADGEPDA